MSEFWLYFNLGLDHITAFSGFDHILFIVVLMAKCRPSEWKKILWIVTAFTIGHSFTLILASFKLFIVNGDLVEMLIPFTILATAIFNLLTKEIGGTKKVSTSYILAIGFGLIHGLGFSNFFGSLVGKDNSIVFQLLCFNLGIEAGQLIVVALFFVIKWILDLVFTINSREWNVFLSGAGAGISIKLILDTFLG